MLQQEAGMNEKEMKETQELGLLDQAKIIDIRLTKKGISLSQLITEKLNTKIHR